VGVDCATELGVVVVDAVTGAVSPPGPEPAAGWVWVAAASAGSSSGSTDGVEASATRSGWVSVSSGAVADTGVGADDDAAVGSGD
jgi:hypothetical protein